MNQESAKKYETKRLILREWRDDDIVAFCQMNADPQVMEYFPHPLSEEETNQMVRRIRNHFEENGFGLWAVEVPGESDFIGFVGLQIPRFDAPFMPCVEIGWRLARRFWGRGLAPEAAHRALEIGFNDFGLDEIVSMTAVVNSKSRRVMEKIGMSYSSKEDFDHPKVPPQSHVYRHVLYRLKADDFCANSKNSS